METININELSFKNETIQETFNLMLNNGFRVFVYDSKNITNCHYSKNDKVAYLQAGRFGGIQISTVHIPTHGIGSGFGEIHGTSFESLFDVTINKLEDGFITAPKWASYSDVKKVKKYTIDTWITKESQRILKYKEVVL